MALHIKDDKADRLARELAKRTGESLTETIVKALEERLERNTSRRREDREARRVAIMEIVNEVRKLPVLDDRTPEDMLYDENGLPV